MQVIIPSRGRYDTIGDKALKLFPDAIVCVHEYEAEKYAPLTPNILVHPDRVQGIAPIYQWMLDNVKDPVCVIVTDDMSLVYSQTGFRKRRIEDPDDVRAIVERTAIAAQDAGARVFGYGQSALPLAYKPMQPIKFTGWVGGLIGIIGRELKYDTSLLLRADVDFCMKSMLRDRYLWIDGRYEFRHSRFQDRGGTSTLRSDDRHKQELARLKKRWGRYLNVVSKHAANHKGGPGGTYTSLQTHVQR